MSLFGLDGAAADYLTPPAQRPDWQDTWTMQRTRRHALTSLSGAYAAARRTLAGLLATVLLLVGAYLVGRGTSGVGGQHQLAATGVLSAGVLAVLLGLALAGHVLFTGVRVLKALRAWSKVRSREGGPGAGAILTLAMLLRLLLAVGVLAAGVAMVLVRLDVLDLQLLTAAGPGRVLWQWATAVTGIVAGAAALAGFVLGALALRRPRPAESPMAGEAGARAETAPDTGSTMATPAAGPATAGMPGAGPEAAGTPAATGWPGRPQEPQQPAWPGASTAVDDVADTRLASQVPRPAERGIGAILPDGRRVAAPGVTLLGRSPAAAAGEQVADLSAITDASVSKTHLALRIEGEGIWATDRASTNGTDLYRGEARYSLVAWEEAPLQAGDELVLGAATVRIEHAG